MEIYSSEEQQVDAIKQFWKDYGTSIIVGAVVGLGGLYGWNYYSEKQILSAEAASEQYQAILAGNAQNTGFMTEAAAFSKDTSQVGYQAMMDLMLAKAAVDAGQLSEAETALKQVIADKPDTGLVMIATLRLARIQAQQEQLGMAIATLEQVTDPAFAAQRDELKGDFLVRQGELDKARLAYQAAADVGGLTASPALQMKIDNLNKA
ncbi:tetratricopeptide repeat protein [Shewanella sp. NIFS-20-20]|uniref:tetratricopeptide repeat protein n=1 Tax=Shewanella sp. NIFS-20-20 TaxID=2853806 RepID=UPI001C4622F1|nr:tetratricopeptide repeat protein [Shewanella sp. NIFS-20-20]